MYGTKLVSQYSYAKIHHLSESKCHWGTDGQSKLERVGKLQMAPVGNRLQSGYITSSLCHQRCTINVACLQP
jgi:hypothetical protein